MRHCKQCRADAVGTLGNDLSRTFSAGSTQDDVAEASGESGKPAKRFAVASKNGVLVDEHFGHAQSFYIYERSGEKTSLIEKREIAQQYCGSDDHGCGSSGHGKFDAVLGALSDCAGVLVMRIGEAPRCLLGEHGIRVFMTYDYIEEAIKNAYATLNKNDAGAIV
jgi:predicted Fe-Mo cluster-binding NifX family protein